VDPASLRKEQRQNNVQRLSLLSKNRLKIAPKANGKILPML
jgi:hypothetical protein